MMALGCYSPAASGAGKKADLSRLVVVGDSLAAGFQNFSLLESQQIHSFPAVLAAQARTPLVQPLMKFPGVPQVLQLVSPGPPPVIAPVNEPIAAMPRVRPDLQPANLAVPGMTLGEALTKRPNFAIPNPTAIDAMTNLILGLPSAVPALSQVERAVALKPTTVLAWIGNNDALWAAVSGDFTLLTPLPLFAVRYGVLLNALSKTGASVVVANLPDSTVIPFFIQPEELARQFGVPLHTIAPRLGIHQGDLLRPSAVPVIAQMLRSGVLSPLTTCPNSIPGLPFADVPCIFRASEIATIRAFIRVYNIAIAVLAAAHGAPVVDIHELIDDIKAKGYVVNERRLTLAAFDGLFSLDGMHPTNTLHAIFANEFIKTMNRSLAAGIPQVSVAQVAKEDPLFPAKK
jgi:hypothetical protein